MIKIHDLSNSSRVQLKSTVFFSVVDKKKMEITGQNIKLQSVKRKIKKVKQQNVDEYFPAYNIENKD